MRARHRLISETFRDPGGLCGILERQPEERAEAWLYRWGAEAPEGLSDLAGIWRGVSLEPKRRSIPGRRPDLLCSLHQTEQELQAAPRGHSCCQSSSSVPPAPPRCTRLEGCARPLGRCPGRKLCLLPLRSLLWAEATWTGTQDTSDAGTRPMPRLAEQLTWQEWCPQKQPALPHRSLRRLLACAGELWRQS